jgi:hypothetical protein
MGLLFCASDLEPHRATMGKFRRSRHGEYLSMEGGEIATKIALKPTQVDVKHTETNSCEGNFLNLCLSMGNKEKGQKKPGSLVDDRSEDQLAVSLYLVGRLHRPRAAWLAETRDSVKVSAKKAPGAAY